GLAAAPASLRSTTPSSPAVVREECTCPSGSGACTRCRLGARRQLFGGSLPVDLVLPVVVSGELIRRPEREAEGHHDFGIFPLAVQDLLVKGILLRIAGLDLLPFIEEVLENVVGGAVHLYALIDELLACDRGLAVEHSVADHGRMDAGNFDDLLQIGAEFFPDATVDHQLPARD